MPAGRVGLQLAEIGEVKSAAADLVQLDRDPAVAAPDEG
jgi:hypothetical protein